MLSNVMHECLQLQFMPTDQHECKCNILAKHRKSCLNTVMLEPLENAHILMLRAETNSVYICGLSVC